MDGGEDTSDLLLKVVGDAEPLHCVDEPELCSLVVASAHRSHQALPHSGLHLVKVPSSSLYAVAEEEKILRYGDYINYAKIKMFTIY